MSPEGAAILSKERFGDNSEAVKTSDAVFKKCDNERKFTLIIILLLIYNYFNYYL